MPMLRRAGLTRDNRSAKRKGDGSNNRILHGVIVKTLLRLGGRIEELMVIHKREKGNKIYNTETWGRGKYAAV